MKQMKIKVYMHICIITILSLGKSKKENYAKFLIRSESFNPKINLNRNVWFGYFKLYQPIF